MREGAPLSSVFAYDGIVYPAIEDKPPKYAIVYRNRWMMREADYVVCAVERKFGGAYTAYRYALRLGKPIYNLLGIRV